MKKRYVLGLIAAGILLLLAETAYAEDMRAVHTEAREKKAVLLEKANKENERAKKEAEESRKKIFSDKSTLERSIARMEGKNNTLETENRALH